MYVHTIQVSFGTLCFRTELSPLGLHFRKLWFSILELSRRCVVVSKYVVLTTKHDLSYSKIWVNVIRLSREVAERFILNKISRVCFTKLSNSQRYFCMKFSQIEITSIAPWLLLRGLRIRRVTMVLTQNIPIDHKTVTLDTSSDGFQPTEPHLGRLPSQCHSQVPFVSSLPDNLSYR